MYFLLAKDFSRVSHQSTECCVQSDSLLFANRENHSLYAWLVTTFALSLGLSLSLSVRSVRSGCLCCCFCLLSVCMKNTAQVPSTLKYFLELQFFWHCLPTVVCCCCCCCCCADCTRNTHSTNTSACHTPPAHTPTHSHTHPAAGAFTFRLPVRPAVCLAAPSG